MGVDRYLVEVFGKRIAAPGDAAVCGPQNLSNSGAMSCTVALAACKRVMTSAATASDVGRNSAAAP